MKRSLRNLLCLAGLAGWLVASPPAEAQWTSAYPFVTVAASFNGFNSYDPNLELISNGVWVGYFNLPAAPSGDTNRFLFTTVNFTNTWKETDQTTLSCPCPDRRENEWWQGYRHQQQRRWHRTAFQFNEVTGAYSVDRCHPRLGGGRIVDQRNPLRQRGQRQ
jgi:hypothetical protein